MDGNKINFEPLRRWFLETQRDMPWRGSPTPYQVWVSEIMLQQTQVKVVIPYFERWMERFPNIQTLAEASIEEVIKLWEGLGYYSRARNLHLGAQQVLQEFGGKLPNNAEDLAKIKGIGPYTVGAILSFAFHQKAAAVDGNVQRVLARLFRITDDFSKGATLKKIWGIAEDILPEQEPWIINEALIELGATVCTRAPQCQKCPLRSSCQSYAHGDAAEIPFKSKKVTIENLYRAVAVIVCEGKLLLRKGDKGAIMSDLHEFPYFPCDPQPEMPQALVSNVPFKLSHVETLPTVIHGFTRYQATLFPAHFTAKNCFPYPNHIWVPIDQIHTLAFSSGHRKILQHFMNGHSGRT